MSFSSFIDSAHMPPTDIHTVLLVAGSFRLPSQEVSGVTMLKAAVNYKANMKIIRSVGSWMDGLPA